MLKFTKDDWIQQLEKRTKGRQAEALSRRKKGRKTTTIPAASSTTSTTTYVCFTLLAKWGRGIE